MKITQVRNATLLIHYAGTRFLIDPMLAPKGSYPGFEGMANSHLRNPLVEHTDRAQCKWNASIAFARTADLWPIYVEVPSGVKEIRAELGEVVVYRGTDIPHWREPLPAGTATVCFFHFVNQPYQGTLR